MNTESNVVYDSWIQSVVVELRGRFHARQDSDIANLVSVLRKMRTNRATRKACGTYYYLTTP